MIEVYAPHQVQSAIEASGAIEYDRHYIMASGNHTLTKIEIDIALRNEEARKAITHSMAEAIVASRLQIVSGIPNGGDNLLDEILPVIPENARPQRIMLKKGQTREDDFRFADPTNWFLAKRSNYRRHRVLFIDDVLSHGTSIAKAHKKIPNSEYLVLWQRSGGANVGGMEGRAIVTHKYIDYRPQECPLNHDGRL